MYVVCPSDIIARSSAHTKLKTMTMGEVTKATPPQQQRHHQHQQHQLRKENLQLATTTKTKTSSSTAITSSHSLAGVTALESSSAVDGGGAGGALPSVIPDDSINNTKALSHPNSLSNVEHFSPPPDVNSSVNRRSTHDTSSTHVNPMSNTTAPTSATTSAANADFIGPSKALRSLFSLPYSTDRNVSVALHTIGGGTILLDSGEEVGGGVLNDGDVGSGSISGGGGDTIRSRRRRQRPQNWNNNNNNDVVSQPQQQHFANEEDEEQKKNRHQLQLAQIRQRDEEERSLLASLSLLLEEERQQQQQQYVGTSPNKGGVANVIENDKLHHHHHGDKRKNNSANEEALSIVPSNALVVSSMDTSTNKEMLYRPPSSSTTTAAINEAKNASSDTPTTTTFATTTATKTTAPHSHGRNDPNDILSSKLHPPAHYLSHAVPPLMEPRQYVNYQCQDMKLLVASDAVIYSHDGGMGGGSGGVGAGGKNAVNEGQNTGSGQNTTSESIAIRIADAGDLRTKMKHHESMIKEGHFIPHPPSSSGIKPQALPPSSYAEALLKGPEEANANTEGGGEECDESLEAKSLGSVKLQTCIIPSSSVGPEWAEFGFSLSSLPPNTNTSIAEDVTAPINDEVSGAGIEGRPPASVDGGGSWPESTTASSVPFSSAPVCTVLDAYLDTIMANVPQLALILREHGFIQNIKLMRTEDIPSLMMHPTTLDGSTGHTGCTPPQPVFSPEIVEMNAAMLLRFLKTNCTRENSTYLLHRTAGETNIQLFDISSISQLRQRKWIWWLALCSYRFACRLEQLQANVLSPHDKVTRREYRKRQRSLLHNTLNLLEDLADMDGGRHETIYAAVCEHLADTYLWNDEADGDVGIRDANKPEPLASSSQPYRKVTVDCLNKAQDHLTNGIKKLSQLLSKAKEENSAVEVEALSMQLYGIHHKLINVCLRLVDHHLQNYFSSNVVHSLRTAARMLSDAVWLLLPLDVFNSKRKDDSEAKDFTRSILLQYSWLWEYSGHFARSFAADDMWRVRGHILGDDLLSLFREVDSASSSVVKNCFGPNWKPRTSVGAASHGQVSLKSLSGIVVLPEDFEQIERSVLASKGCHEAIARAKSILYQRPQLKRDQCLVLVAASVCYSHSIEAYQCLTSNIEQESDNLPSSKSVPPLLCQRLGDACNEIGKILLNESRLVMLSESSSSDGAGDSIGKSHVSAIMLTAAQFWFVEGLEQFNAGNDLRNIALLRCNLCQCCKIRANTNVILPGSSKEGSKESETYLQEAVDHLVLAHESMGERDADPMTWDMVSEELAATLLVLGVRRRQSSLIASSSASPVLLQEFRPAPGLEKAIVEPMERSCKIYESLGTAHAAHQAAAAHYQLAIYFSKVWTCQRDEQKTREKLVAAFKHFGLAHQYFFHSVGKEPTFVVLSLDFSNLYSAVSGEECLSKALACCLDCRKAFSSDSITAAKARPNVKDWFAQMTTLSDNLFERITKLLLSLVKIEKEKELTTNKYKAMYRQVLTYKLKSTQKEDPNGDNGHELPSSFAVYGLLQALSDASS